MENLTFSTTKCAEVFLYYAQEQFSVTAGCLKVQLNSDTIYLETASDPTGLGLSPTRPLPPYPCQLQLPTAGLLSPELLADQLQLECSAGPSSLGSLYSLEWPAELRETFYVLDH